MEEKNEYITPSIVMIETDCKSPLLAVSSGNFETPEEEDGIW